MKAANGLNLSPMDVSERTLREIYLKPYLAAIEADVFTIMAAHNEVNGVPCHMDKRLLTDVLRDDYDFTGFYVSDWLDIHRIETLHQVARDFKEACYLAVDAGMDMNMHGPDFLEAVVSLVEEGKLEPSRIDDACEKILRAKFDLGLFEKRTSGFRSSSRKHLYTQASTECLRNGSSLDGAIEERWDSTSYLIGI